MKAHVIFLVVGHTGEYEDRDSWNVAWRHTPEDAIALRDACQAHADAWFRPRREEIEQAITVSIARHESVRFSVGQEFTERADELDHPTGLPFQDWKDRGPDPNMRIDFNGTRYEVEAIADDPRTPELAAYGA